MAKPTSSQNHASRQKTGVGSPLAPGQAPTPRDSRVLLGSPSKRAATNMSAFLTSSAHTQDMSRTSPTIASSHPGSMTTLLNGHLPTWPFITSPSTPSTTRWHYASPALSASHSYNTEYERKAQCRLPRPTLMLSHSRSTIKHQPPSRNRNALALLPHHNTQQSLPTPPPRVLFSSR